MSNVTDSLAETFDVEPVLAEVVPVIAAGISLPEVVSANAEKPKIDEKVQSAEDDLELARITIRSVLDQAKDALAGIIDVAEEDESARSYEVAANMMKNISEIAQSLVALHKTMKDVRPKGEINPNQGGMNYIDKAVFVGNPSDLLDQVKYNKPNDQ